MTLSPASSRYEPPTSREFLYGDQLSIAASATGRLTWDHALGPDVILSRSSLSVPTIAVAGTYFISAMASGTLMTAGAQFAAWIEMDLDGEDMQVTDQSSSTVAGTTTICTLSACWHVPAGAKIRLSVQNQDAGAILFNLSDAYIQRLA